MDGLVNDVVWRAAAWVEAAFDRLGVRNAQASWLAQVERDELIGQECVPLSTIVETFHGHFYDKVTNKFSFLNFGLCLGLSACRIIVSINFTPP